VGGCPEDSFAVDNSLEEKEDNSAAAEHLVEAQDKSVVALPAAVDILQHNGSTHFYQTVQVLYLYSRQNKTTINTKKYIVTTSY